MVTKRKSARRAAPRRRTYAARRAAPRRRRAKSGVTYIPSAMATAALVAVNAGNIKTLYTAITNHGKETAAKSFSRAIDGLKGNNTWINNSYKAFISGSALVTDAAALAGGYVAGEVVKKYAPGVIKRPLGKIAKKIPKVI